jgi:hypothetical protein
LGGSIVLFENRQELKMSISGISAASLAAYFQQSKKTNATGQASAAQPSFATQAAIATQASTGTPGSTATQAAAGPQPDGQAHRRHHHHGGAGGPASDLLQSGTASAGGTNILNTRT